MQIVQFLMKGVGQFTGKNYEINLIPWVWSQPKAMPAHGADVLTDPEQEIWIVTSSRYKPDLCNNW